MNKTILIGRLTKNPEAFFSTSGTKIARYTLAVNRPFKRDGEQQADFIRCIAFEKNAEFAEKYLYKGTKIAVTGRIQTGSYTNQAGQKIYTTDVIVENHEFCEKKADNSNSVDNAYDYNQPADAYMPPDGIENELPFA